MLVALCAPLLLYFSVYISAPGLITRSLRFSVTRLTMQVAPLGLCLAAFAAARPLRQPRRGLGQSCATRISERTPAIEFA
ncbi:MAG: hypothetical protein DLM52_13610 [Chthoniobacterales bacterium]|nr:MAG: hypothetical protein DLM52_13610 [Chthoniobacterales bacterium]